jgi:hypothetical protein
MAVVGASVDVLVISPNVEVSIKIHGVLAYLVYVNIKMIKNLHLSLIAIVYEKTV